MCIYNLSEQMQQVMKDARLLANKYRHRRYGIEHVFLSLLDSDTKKTWASLLRLGLDPSLIKRDLLVAMESLSTYNKAGTTANPSGMLLMILDLAEKEAGGHDKPMTQTDFLIACVIQVTNTPFRLMQEHGFTLAKIMGRACMQ